MLKRVAEILRRHFIAGALIAAPLILTYVLLKFLFEAIDGILSPFLTHALGYTVPGLGLVTTILLLILTGMVTRSFIGASLFRKGEKLLVSFPIVRTIYTSAKQLVEGVSLPQKRSFKQVALVEYPRRGIYALSFIVNRPALEHDGKSRDMICLFIPSTPTPISGIVILSPPEDVILLEMSVEEGIKFLVSGGIMTPERLLGKRMTSKTSLETGTEPTESSPVTEDSPL